MIGFVGTTPFLRVALWVAMETMRTLPSYYIKVKINPMHEVNLRVSVQYSLDILLSCQCAETHLDVA